MKQQIKQTIAGVAALWVLGAGGAAWAGVPLNTLQGGGGVAFNPLAYLAGQNQEPGRHSLLSKPQFGVWYVHLGDVDVDWTAFGVAETVAGRLELSYGHEVIAPAARNIHKNNLGAKVLLVPENQAGRTWVPALSAGLAWKRADDAPAGVDAAGLDLYAVATKLVTQLPRPVLISAGVLSTSERVTGVFGFDPDRKLTGFANLDVIPLSYLALGIELKQGARYQAFKNASYWDAHLAYLAGPHLTLVAAYVNAGDETSTRTVGLGSGLVLSAQHAF
ncbi:MAG: DUF3034 family protein [Candidatus Latescibacterota bacterium]|jgi:hypothetical protein